MRRLLLLTCLLTCYAGQGLADNGAIARATPAVDVVIDGNLDDWPPSVARHPVARDGNGDLVAADSNFEAFFRAAYDRAAGAIYLALEVVDDVHVVSDDDGAAWTNFDSVILYIDFNHTVTGSGAALYLTLGDQRSMLSDETSWDADVASADWSTVDAAVSRQEERRTTVYEWRLRSPQPLASNMVLGLDFLINDQDAPDAETNGRPYSWGPGFGKSQAGGRTGDLWLVNPREPTGALTGHLGLPPTMADEQASPARVRVQSQTHPSLRLDVLADETGTYRLDALPEGTYEVSSAYPMVRQTAAGPRMVAPAAATSAQVVTGTLTTAPTMARAVAAIPIATPERGALFTFEATDAARLDQVVSALMAYYQVPGVSLALVKDGERVYHQVYGTRNAYTGEPVTEDTLFEAASITKAVFAFAVNRLAERGEIDLDRPLYTYLPFDDIAHDPRYEKITARHALSHQTGFPNWRYMNDDGRLDIKFYPGIQYGYSGEGFEYLGRVVAHLTGTPLEDVVRRETVQTMGMTDNVYFAEGPALQAQASRGHLAGMSGPHDFPGDIGVAHSLYTEAKQFSNFMTSLLAQRGLSAEGYAHMLEPQVATPLDPEDRPQWPGRYGLGFHLMNSPFGLAYGHGGNNGNFTCQFELYPEHAMGFVVFTNADSGSLLVNALRDYLVIGAGPSD